MENEWKVTYINPGEVDKLLDNIMELYITPLDFGEFSLDYPKEVEKSSLEVAVDNIKEDIGL